jgi:hypothetical protein
LTEPQRFAPRFRFSAFAEITQETSGAAVATRVKELSLYGCYLELDTPMPRGTPVIVKVFQDDDFFEAKASVIYVQPNLGTGLVFRDVKPHFLAILQKWLTLALRNSKAAD